MIRRDHPGLSISQQCRLVKLSRSAFYYAPVGLDAATLALMKAIGRVAKLARSTRSHGVLRPAEWTDLAHQMVPYDLEVP